MQTKEKTGKNILKVTYSMDREIAEQLDEFCNRTARTKTKVVEIAVKEYLDRHKSDE